MTGVRGTLLTLVLGLGLAACSQPSVPSLLVNLEQVPAAADLLAITVRATAADRTAVQDRLDWTLVSRSGCPYDTNLVVLLPRGTRGDVVVEVTAQVGVDPVADGTGTTRFLGDDAESVTITLDGPPPCVADAGTDIPDAGPGGGADGGVPIDMAVTSVAAGADFSCAVHEHSVFCWGANDHLQLGSNGNASADPVPVMVSDPVARPLDAIHLAAGARHACAADATGLWCWGKASEGQVAVTERPPSSLPVAVQPAADPRVSALFGGGDLTCAGRDALRCWGSWGEMDFTNPVFVGLDSVFLAELSGHRAVAFAPSGESGCALFREGSADALACRSQGLALDVDLGTVVVAGVAVGNGFQCFITLAGQVSCWGGNAKGQLGTSDFIDRGAPSPVVGPGGYAITGAVEVQAGVAHACARLGTGRVSCWGDNSFHQVSISGSPMISIASEVSTAASTPLTNVVDLAVGWNHACAIRESGDVWCWGANESLQRGNGTPASSSNAAPVLF